MFDAIASRYELVNRLMTFGLDARWRRRAVSDLRLPTQSIVLDIAAGTGDFTRELNRQGYVAVATDLSYGMLHVAREVAIRVQANAARLPFRSAGFDGVTCGYALRNFHRPRRNV
jgi:demethylmenaquinone methyltransferase/2-methoxy-6-polyprenyl-1,4-benzoquinol methylase